MANTTFDLTKIVAEEGNFLEPQILKDVKGLEYMVFANLTQNTTDPCGYGVMTGQKCDKKPVFESYIQRIT